MSHSYAPALQHTWKQVRKHQTKLIASLLLGIAFVLILRRGGLPILPDAQQWQGVSWWTVPTYAATMVVWSFLRATRTRHLLQESTELSLKDLVSLSWIGYLAIFVLPFRMGEMVRPALLQQRAKIPLATSLGLCGAERVIDGLVLMVILSVAIPLGIPLSPLPDRIGHLPIPVVTVPAAAYSALLVFLALFTSMVLFYWRRDFAKRTTVALLGWISPRIAQTVSDQVEKLSNAFAFLPSPRRLVPFVLETILYWAVAAIGMWLLARGAGLHELRAVHGFTILGVLGLGIIVPGAPGYFGAFQGSVYAGLAMYIAQERVLGAGSVYVFLLYASQLSMMFVMAIAAGLASRR